MLNKLLKVLILEDNPFDAELNLKTLQKGKWNVDSRIATNESSFSRLLSDFDPDIILSDYNLPRFNGMDALRLTVEKKPLTPFIIVTGSLDEETAVDCIKQGAWDYVLKEHLIRLNPAVKNAIELHEERRQRQLAELSLIESEEHYRVLTQNSPDIIMRFDRQYRHLFVNNAIYDLLQLKPEAFLNKSHQEMGIFEPHLCEIWEEGLRKVFETKKPHELEFIVPSEKGNAFIEWRIFPEFTQQGEVNTVIAIARDITERKETQDALVRSMEHYRALSQNTPDVIMRFDRQYRHLFVNNAIYDQLNKRPEEFINKTHHEIGIFDPAMCDFWESVIQKVFETGKPNEVEFSIPGKTGLIYIEWRLFPEFSPEGDVVTVLAIARDITFKKDAEESLRINGERLRMALEATSDGLWDWNMKTNEIYFSSRYFTMLGYQPGELKSDINIFGDLIHPDDIGKLKGYVDELSTNPHKSLEMEARLKRKDGTYAWILTRGKVFAINESNAPLRIVGTNVDISVRKRQEDIQNVVFEIGNAVVATRNLDELFVRIQEILGRVIDTKNCYIALYDKKTDKITLPFHRDEKDRFLEFPAGKTLTAYVINSGKAQLVDAEVEKKLSASGVVELYGAPAHSWLGVPLRVDNKIIGVFTVQSYDEKISYSEADVDILEFVSDQIALAIARKKDEDNIRENELKLRRIIESSPDGLLVTDSRGEIIENNSSILDLLRIKNKILKGRQFIDFVSKSDHDKARRITIETHNNGYSKSKELVLCREDGSEFIGSISLGLIRDDVKNSESIVINVKDITERIKYETDLKLAKERAEESDRLKSAFLSNMSHEIRTPMNAIVGFAELLAQTNASAEDRKEFISHINQGTENLLNLIDDIIDISKIEAGQIRISKSTFRLSTLLDELQGLFMKSLKKQNREKLSIVIDNRGNNADINLISDSFRLRQVFMNLISNSIKFTETGEIRYGIKQIEPKRITFYVKDTGIGIAEDKQKLIFDRFRQGHDTKTKFYGGTGLGLAISKHLAELMGGEITVESQLGKGSEFIFSIEFIESHNKIAISEPAEYKMNAEWGNKTILVAEDETSNYLIIEHILQRTKAKLLWAKDGGEAVELFTLHPETDLVLMDIQLPVLNGYQAASQIKKIRKDIPIIAQTAYAMAGEREKSKKSGCDDYISKPIKPHDLIALISKFLS